MRLSKILSYPFAAGIAVGVVLTAGAATLRGSDVFSDVPSGSYYDEAVGEMNSLGIIKGSNGKFRPGDNVNRAELAVMFQRLRDELTGNVEQDDEEEESSSSSRSSRSSSSSSTSSASSTSFNPKGAIRFTTADLKVPENVSTHKITVAVVRTGGNEGSVTIDYTMTAGTATEGSDYTKVSGTLSFANKETSKTFEIAIKDDSTNEGNETATITLSNPGNGVSLATPSVATLTIQDDEAGSTASTSSSKSSSSSSTGPSVGFSATQYSVDEDAGTLTVTVVRAGSSSSAGAVNYATSNGSGKSGSEYTSVSGTLNFAANEVSKQFTVSIFNDSTDDGAKTFNLMLSSPSSMTLTPNLNTAVVTINDDETVAFGSGSFKFSRSAYGIAESAGSVVVTVQRTGGSIFPASVAYQTTSITASGGSDFTHISGQLSFAVGEASKIIVIPIVKDAVADTGETFAVDLSGATGGVPLIVPYSATITIE